MTPGVTSNSAAFNGQSSSLWSTGTIAAVTLGVVVFCALLMGSFVLMRRRRRKQSWHEGSSQPGQSTGKPELEANPPVAREGHELGARREVDLPSGSLGASIPCMSCHHQGTDRVSLPSSPTIEPPILSHIGRTALWSLSVGSPSSHFLCHSSYLYRSFHHHPTPSSALRAGEEIMTTSIIPGATNPAFLAHNPGGGRSHECAPIEIIDIGFSQPLKLRISPKISSPVSKSPVVKSRSPRCSYGTGTARSYSRTSYRVPRTIPARQRHNYFASQLEQSQEASQTPNQTS